jgi:hypothetical protein
LDFVHLVFVSTSDLFLGWFIAALRSGNSAGFEGFISLSGGPIDGHFFKQRLENVDSRGDTKKGSDSDTF